MLSFTGFVSMRSFTGLVSMRSFTGLVFPASCREGMASVCERACACVRKLNRLRWNRRAVLVAVARRLDQALANFSAVPCVKYTRLFGPGVTSVDRTWVCFFKVIKKSDDSVAPAFLFGGESAVRPPQILG